MKFKLSSFALSLFGLIFLTVTASAQLTFDRPKTEPPLPNPYTMSVQREQILTAVREMLKACAIPIDEELSKANEGKIVTKQIVFSKGVTVRNDLEHVATLPAGDVRNWLQGRCALEIIALPVDQKNSQLQVAARIQGRMADVAGSKWIDAQSNGTLEDEVLRALAGKVLGIDLSMKKKGSNTRRLLNCEY